MTHEQSSATPDTSNVSDDPRPALAEGLAALRRMGAQKKQWHAEAVANAKAQAEKPAVSPEMQAAIDTAVAEQLNARQPDVDAWLAHWEHSGDVIIPLTARWKNTHQQGWQNTTETDWEALRIALTNGASNVGMLLGASRRVAWDPDNAEGTAALLATDMHIHHVSPGSRHKDHDHAGGCTTLWRLQDWIPNVRLTGPTTAVKLANGGLVDVLAGNHQVAIPPSVMVYPELGHHVGRYETASEVGLVPEDRDGYKIELQQDLYLPLWAMSEELRAYAPEEERTAEAMAIPPGLEALAGTVEIWRPKESTFDAENRDELTEKVDALDLLSLLDEAGVLGERRGYWTGDHAGCELWLREGSTAEYSITVHNGCDHGYRVQVWTTGIDTLPAGGYSRVDALTGLLGLDIATQRGSVMHQLGLLKPHYGDMWCDYFFERAQMFDDRSVDPEWLGVEVEAPGGGTVIADKAHWEMRRDAAAGVGQAMYRRSQEIQADLPRYEAAKEENRRRAAAGQPLLRVVLGGASDQAAPAGGAGVGQSMGEATAASAGQGAQIGSVQPGQGLTPPTPSGPVPVAFGGPAVGESYTQAGDPGPFPIDALPEVIRNHAKWVMNAVNVPGSMVGPMYLPVMSAACNRAVIIPRTGWEEDGGSLWSIIIAPPSSRKTPALKKVQAPVDSAQKLLRERTEAMRRKSEFDAEALEEAAEDAKRKYHAALKKSRVEAPGAVSADPTPHGAPPVIYSISGAAPVSDDPEVVRLKALYEQLELEARQARAEVPARAVLSFEDATDAALQDLMESCGGYGFLIATEASAWFKGVTREDSAHVTPIYYLKAYSGESFRIFRRGRGEVWIDDPFLPMLHMIQPEMLKAALKPDRDGHNVLVGNGAWARFGAAYVEKVDADWYNKPIDDPQVVVSAYCGLIEREFLRSYGREEPLKFGLDKDAQLVMEAVYNRVELIIVEQRKLPSGVGMAEEWGKACGRMLRIARVFRQLEMSDVEVADTVTTHMIGAEHLRDAWQITEWMLASQAYAMGGSKVDSEDDLVVKTVAWLRRRLAKDGAVEYVKLRGDRNHRDYLKRAIAQLVEAGEVTITPGPITNATVAPTENLTAAA